jgi:ABC-2 type transport system ATP-binding protein
VEEICDHIILVNNGKKILDGTIHNIKQEYKENLFRLEAASYENISHPSFEVIRKEKSSIVIRINEGFSTNDVLSHFIGSGVQILGFHEILPSLNEIFIKKVEGTPLARQFQNVPA